MVIRYSIVLAYYNKNTCQALYILFNMKNLLHRWAKSCYVHFFSHQKIFSSNLLKEHKLVRNCVVQENTHLSCVIIIKCLSLVHSFSMA